MKDEISIVICGDAGHGIQTVESFIVKVLKSANYNVFATKEYMSRVRGGSNSTEIRVSSKKISAYVEKIDFLLPLDKDAIPHLKKRISKRTLVLGDKTKLPECYPIIDIPLSKIAEEIGGEIFSNIVAGSALFGIFELDIEIIFAYIRSSFKPKGEEAVNKNIEAVKRGHAIGHDLKKSLKINIEISKDQKIQDQIILSGAEAIALGAIAGGCNFISAYPMTPSTGVFTFLSQHAKDFGIISEQAEDEISAMNMALGAWYMGARALVNTSGGGFDLMAEGLSLAGMIESPVVINLAQRPGPSTGLPTRTAQEDLEIALYSGHGEFPRIILAPGNLQDAFYLTQLAFILADKFQVPVFIMSDQNLADSYNNIEPFKLDGLKIEKAIVETKADYKRYVLTKSGISPRGIPGLGLGLVLADSDEHDEEGHITEDLELSPKMADKRLRKLLQIRKEAIPPELIGNKTYKTLIVGWGSTYGAIVEAMDKLNDKNISFLYFKQVYPLHPDTIKYLKKAKKTILIENNATAQFGKIIKLETGHEFDQKILKYNGMPFSVEELIHELK